MSADEKIFTHESYGLIGFARVTSSGNRTFFGSALTNHYSSVALTLRRAERVHSLSRDRFAATDELFRVELTVAQFADLLTTMNCGEGVPCTIQHLLGKQMAPPPPVKSETREIREGFREKTEALAVKMRTARATIVRQLEEKMLGKGARAEIVKEVDALIREVGDNLPFVLSQFQEAASRVVSTAKAEVEAFTMSSLVNAGLARLRELGGSPVDETTFGVLPEKTETPDE